MARKAGARRLALGIILACGTAALALAVLLVWDRATRPFIEIISPSIADPGDMLEIRGRNFGAARGSSRVSLGGIQPTASAYLHWDEGLIRLRLPASAESGLIRVQRGSRASNSLLVTTRSSLPRPAGDGSAGGAPSLRSALVFPIAGASSGGSSAGAAAAGSVSVGSELILTGLNFGMNQEGAQVLFSAAMETRPEGPPSAAESGYLASPWVDAAYSHWSDNEIRVRVPDGAASGSYFVQSARGSSNSLWLELSHPAGTKVYRDRKTYVIRYSVEVSSVKASGSNALYLWIPRPLGTASQRSVRTVSMSRKPTMENFREIMLYRFEGLRDGQSLQTSHDFILDAYEVEAQPRIEAIRPASDSALATAFLRHEEAVPAGDDAVRAASALIVGKEKNPWRRAKLIYDWICSAELKLSSSARDSTALSLLESRSGDAWAAACLYAALCRSAGLPATPCAGVLVDPARATLPHCWAEFWIDGLGWVPVDPAMGAGMDLPSPKNASDRRAWYFGNMDSSRIIFSRGYTELGRQAPGSRLKPAGRFYALQDVTEEAVGQISSYTAFWSDITVVGVY